MTGIRPRARLGRGRATQIVAALAVGALVLACAGPVATPPPPTPVLPPPQTLAPGQTPPPATPSA